MPRSSAATALRESFGDRLPDISRKITACVSCRKLKVKCSIASTGPPCTRCSTRELSCTVNKSLQMLLEDDASRKESIEQRLEALECADRQGGQEGDSTRTTSLRQDMNAGPHALLAPHDDLPLPMPNPEAPGPTSLTLNLESNLGAFPASSVHAQRHTESKTATADLISRAVITSEAASGCLMYFLQHLNPYLHGILDPRATLSDVRAHSSLLIAAICAVASFCSSSERYQACYDAFVKDVSSTLFLSSYTYDDVRALCIGAFWLDDIGHTLVGLAVRISSQLDLHRCITKMPHTKQACYDRTRLFYLVFLCDHHCSLKYGRPPMTQEWRSQKSPTAFLHCEFSNHRDLGLVSQVELWSITRAVFEQFGADIESPDATQKLSQISKLSQAYEQWRQTWRTVLAIAEQSKGPMAGISDLYFHCAKLYLYSHIHRGRTHSQRQNTTPEIDEIIGHFQDNALSVLRLILDGEMCLLDLPAYFATMLAFATASSIKTARDDDLSNEDQQEILSLVHRLRDCLHAANVSSYSSHPYLSIAKGLEQSLEGLQSGIVLSTLPPNYMNFDESMLEDDIWNVDFTNFGSNWMDFNEH